MSESEPISEVEQVLADLEASNVDTTAGPEDTFLDAEQELL